MEKHYTVPEGRGDVRLDAFLSAREKEWSRSLVKRFIEGGAVLVNDTRKKSSYQLKEGDRIDMVLPDPEPPVLAPCTFPVPVVYEDDHVLVVDKPEGLTVHPPNKEYHRTLVNALFTMGKSLFPVSFLRPGVVHRLDKETSGLLVLAKTADAYYNLIDQFKRRTVRKEYRALVWGLMPQDRVTVDMPLGRDRSNRLKMKVGFLNSKEALTEVSVIRRLKDATYLSIRLMTGRTHQIRVHLNFLGFPITGDKKYGRKDGYAGLMLHARRLGFTHPVTEKVMEFEAPVPERFLKFIAEHEDI